ncbi:MAG: ABC1 kinase family protein [Pseudobdellovibrionaceae bacterium]
MAKDKKVSSHIDAPPVKNNLPPTAEEPAEFGLDRIKSSVFSRGMSMAKLTLQAGAQLAGQGLAQALSGKKTSGTEADHKKWDQFLKAQAANISNELGQLKGGLMKAGQMLSMYGEHFLPPEANQFLKTLQSDSQPLKWSAIQPFLKKYLSEDQLNLLDIQTQALASASMGQVHRATIKSTGEQIVLKIQYPDVDKAIDSDLKAIRSLMNLLKLLPRDVNMDPVFAEVRDMLLQETDYQQEAERTQEFYEKVQGDARFIVPKVYPEFSNKKVLATSYEHGLRADDTLVQKLSQERRNRLAGHFLDLYFKELFLWKLIQTDPHSGNYKIRLSESGEDQIILLDFGATRSYGDEFLNSYHGMVKGSLFNDKSLFIKSAQDLKFIREGDDPELVRIFEEFCFETVEPFIAPEDPRNNHNQIDADGCYDWKNTDLPMRLKEKVVQILRNFEWRTPPREILFLDRKTGGVFIFLSMLRAKINGRSWILPYLQK